MTADERPLILVLGTSERVGSNWVLDSLRHSTIQHNEHLRQQLGRQHPLAPLTTISATSPAVHAPLAAYWVESFKSSKYRGGRHVVKETNLYFTAAALLALFPDSPVVVLSRSPLGVASSFTRGALWKRWDYGNIYRHVAALAHEDEHRRWSRLVPDDDPCPPVALTRLITLNTALLADALGDREHAHVSYEAAVLDWRSATRPLAGLVEEFGSASSLPSKETPSCDSTFATTNHKDGLVARLRPGTAEVVTSETSRCLSLLRSIVAPASSKRAERWLAGADSYALATFDNPEAAPPRLTTTIRKARTEPAYVPLAPPHTRWRNLLVSNAEMCVFLNGLTDAGLKTTLHGVHIVAIPMPHERGGRLHPTGKGWRVSPGYEHHPAYWITWIGAAAYAFWEGARLPTSSELDALTAGAHASNAEYQMGDVTPVDEPGLGPKAVHHRVGNLRVWCCDGPGHGTEWAPLTRYRHGAAWNTPASREEVTSRRSRHLLGASCGVGVRLTCASSTGPRCSLNEVADRLSRWLTLLGDRTRPLSELDREAIALLS
ncbi:sulfatase-modifying factor enzyme 1 [Haloactinospora alba]|uniref:Sulfatase-modifying factor enzyme 1 n=1 Tax=Haloactinospora alba TaxID=405555 RepID=A0A543NEU3_9ACTN|nr:sulfatase-modifying factor enzyme 1 [Haloactinospora alba]